MSIRILSLSFSLFCAVWAAAQPASELAEARKLAESGQFAAAEQAFARLLSQNPDRPELLTGAGFNYAWNKQHEQARLFFEKARSLDPNNGDALIGAAYNEAWAGHYETAKASFQRFQSLRPESPEGLKGLGYIALWQEDASTAQTCFQTLARQYPRSAEFHIALAQAHLLACELRDARAALEMALHLEPENRTARNLLQSTQQVAAPLEFDAWAGRSTTDGESKIALRTLQLSGQITKTLRAYAKYDNSLTTDLAALVRANQDARALSLGGTNQWNKRLITRLEYGVRFLPGKISQHLLSGEQVVFLPFNLAVKAGGFYGRSAQVPDEWMGYAGIRVPVTRWYAIEPIAFLSRVENAARAEKRILLNHQLRSAGGYELNLGILYGKAAVDEAIGNQNITGGYLTGFLPFSRLVWGQISLRWEKTPLTDLTVATAGIKIRLEK